MYLKMEAPEWKELYQNWEYSCSQLFPQIINDCGLLDLPIKSPEKVRIGDEIIDWCFLMEQREKFATILERGRC